MKYSDAMIFKGILSKYKAGMITDENGQDIDIHTPDLLYDFISNNGVMYQKEM